ncbi:sulfotransferase family 2 domain-containing protein [Demequina sp.]|uniref:sulfotransferase family 2 domain-containing protein n=1 Tax=Demequina sp. TaxID=2050685 RepID=UPI003A8890B7
MPIMRKDGTALLFVHVPKTGGSSIEAAFRSAGWRVNYLDGNFDEGSLNQLRRCSPQHVDAADLAATFAIDRFDAVFGFVREPLPRMVSEYLWRHRKRDSVDTSGRAFEEWLSSTFRKAKADPWLHDNHIRPQVDFILPQATMMRFEDGLEAGMARIARDTGLDVPVTLPRKYSAAAVTGVRSSDVNVTDKAKRLVAKFYAQDYRRLGYAKPQPSR